MSGLVSLSWDSSFEPNSYDADGHIEALMGRFKSLPRHIARKHLMAAMRRIMKPGIPFLRRVTPPTNTRRGRRAKGQRPTSTGALRRSVTVRTGQTGANRDFDAFVWSVLGYRYGWESRKAIWLQYGTSTGGPALGMIEKAMAQFGRPAASQLAAAMAEALEKAIKEDLGGRNPVREI